MRFTVFDLESDGLLDTVSKIHCVSFQIYENTQFISKGSITDYDQMRRFFQSQENLVGHNIVKYDKRVLQKILGIDIKAKLIDTLGLSYYIFPYRKKHGLEGWGEDLGVKKPEVDDWENLSIEEYIHRCEEDVEINSRLFIQLFDYLVELYGNLEQAFNFTQYLTFKLECIADQEEIGIPLDVELTKHNLSILIPQFEERTRILSSVMPEEYAKVLKTRPKNMFKADGSLSAHGIKWIQYLKDNNLPPETEVHREEPNPGSDVQLKNWLFSLGWQPQTFKESKSKGNKGAQIPQVSLPFGQGICPSVRALFEKEPKLEELDGYFKIKHRIGVLESYLENMRDGKVYSTAHGFTNTLRLTHSKPVVNLPKPGVFFGKEVREVLTVPDDTYIMCGSDVSGLEDSTKRHYIFFHDPEYVKEMEVPGFDPHIDIGVLAGLITEEEAEFFKKVEAMSDEEKQALTDEEKALYKSVKEKRGTSKSTNFAATYGALGPKIAEVAKTTYLIGQELYDTYWARNWAVKQIAEEAIVKRVRGQRWLYNPLSGYWMYLKADKDRFSTLNQSSGVFVFDSWVYEVRKRLLPLGIKIAMQYHDEVMLYFKKEHKDTVDKILRESMEIVNKKLKLNVEIKISIDYGQNYAAVH